MEAIADNSVGEAISALYGRPSAPNHKNREQTVKNYYFLILIAIAANVLAVYFMKKSNGMTMPWPTFGMVMSNLITLWFLGQAMADGANVGPAVTILTVGVMIGSFIIGWSAGERVTALQAVGVSLAIGGVVVANLAVGSS
jgi:multidrug transporter EmrE-like cation transporter